MDTLLLRMTEIIEIQHRQLGSETPVVKLGHEEPSKTRILVVDDQPAFQISMPCGTCGYLLKRRTTEVGPISIESVRRRLADGLRTTDAGVVEAFGALLPRGEYRVSLLRIRPTLVRPGDADDYFSHEMVASWGMDPLHGIPHWPGTAYYRIGSTSFTWKLNGPPWSPARPVVQWRPVEWRSALFEFVVPLTPLKAELNEATADGYRSGMRSGKEPTAVAFSVLDIEKWSVEYAESPELDAHWIWSHFLLDGHHKIYAAATENTAMTLLSITAADGGLSQPSDIDQAFEVIRGAETVVNPGSPT
jgi:hypothetical protein